ncbi:MAG: flagellar basal body P-ring protein FlgI [Pirellulaceae bacterium]
MMPHLRSSHSLDRRRFFAAGLAGLASSAIAGILLPGCATPLMRGQTPEADPLAEPPGLELVGDSTRPYGLNWIKLEAVALVTNLHNTGSDPPAGDLRSRLIGEMMSHEVRKSDKVLASPTTSLVVVTGYLPPGVQKGDAFDVEVRVPSRSETASLRSGWLMQTRLRQMQVLQGTVHTGSVDGLAQGDLLVDAIFDGGEDKIYETRARVLGGGISKTTRQLGLAIAKDGASIRMSTMIGAAINDRFHAFEAGVKKGVAVPQRDNYIDLSISPRYQHNLARYLRVVRNIPLRENPVERIERLALLEKKLLEPATAALAALQLEALGNEGVPALTKGLPSNDPEVRFYSAEALAYLDQAEAAAALGKAAQDEPAFRWHALTALATMTHVSALDALNELLHVQSVETRYGAFRALRIRNAADPATRGEVLDKKFRYHLIPTTGEPLVHVARSRMPEIVVFGHEQRLKSPKFLFAGREIMVTTLENGDLKVGRFQAGYETKYETCSTELDKLIRTIVKLGGGYADVIQCLQEARKAGCLESRIAVEALPRPNRKFYRDDDPLPEAPADEPGSESPGGESSPPLVRLRAATPSPELFTDGIETASANEKAQEEVRAVSGETYVAPEYQPQPGILDRLNPFGGQ